MSCIKNYEDLANAIIIQAVSDYRKKEEYRDRVERFFRSGWYKLLTGVDGEYLISKLRREVADNEK